MNVWQEGFVVSMGLGIVIVALWIFLLTKKYVSVFYVSKPKSWVRNIFIFILVLGIRLLFFITEYDIIPLMGMLTVLVFNILFIYLLAEGSKMSILAGATLLSAVDISIDISVFFGLNAILSGARLMDVYFYLLVILIYPSLYFMLGVASKHEEETRRKNRRKFQFTLLFGVVVLRIISIIFINNTPEILFGREISNDMFTVLVLLLLAAILGEGEVSEVSYQKQIRDIEYKALKRYMEDIEQQTLELQKFKHDYRNILMSLEWYILKSGNSELEDYFNARIKQISRSWDDEEMVFECLNRINEKEIRSILRIKIQRMISLNMHVEIEQVDEINSINIDPIVMVRTIGILLDNAMEEVEQLPQGKIKIAFKKEKSGVAFYVSNNFRESHCSLEKIREKSFTTKGEGRGIGLQILEDFSTEHKNFFIETKIADNWFTQIVTISS